MAIYENNLNIKPLGINVYEATQERLKFIFDNFDTIIISFSGGKDSGVLLHLTMDYIEKHNLKIKPILFHQDMEAQYQATTDYVMAMYEKFKKRTEPYWFCQPIATRTALSSYEMFWYPWDDTKPEVWCRKIPRKKYVYTLQKNPFEYYEYGMDYHSHAEQFERWIRDKKGGRVCSLLGIRTQESLQRYCSIVNKREQFQGKKWITKNFKDVYSASPIYDWDTEDIWTCNAKFGYDYNHLYDLFYKAGVPFHCMRVASPFSDEAKESLNLYRIIDPEMWQKLLNRVVGVNYASIYTGSKAFGNNFELPPNYTWKKYTKFLLETLPDFIKHNYKQKFKTSIKFWRHECGGGFKEEQIQELESLGYKVKRNGISPYGKNGDLIKTLFLQPLPDSMEDVTTIHQADLPTWKRMCLCILKNDHICSGMGFGVSASQGKMIQALKKAKLEREMLEKVKEENS